jgi:hypothetical protein
MSSYMRFLSISIRKRMMRMRRDGYIRTQLREKLRGIEMKDALGHGSNERGVNPNPLIAGHAPPVATHAAAIHALPGHGALSDDQAAANNAKTEADRSDAMYHAEMPIANFTGQVQDLLGLWSGSQKPEPLSASETKQVNDTYADRGDWRGLARQIQDQRRTYATTVSKPNVRGPK